MKTHHEKSSGNVFADLGLPNSERSALGSTRRKARQSSRKTVSGKIGRISAPSGGSAMPSRIETATALVMDSAVSAKFVAVASTVYPNDISRAPVP